MRGAHGPPGPTMTTDDASLRTTVRDLLQSGLKTEVEPRAYTGEEIQRIVERLQAIPAADVGKKLVTAGFTLGPYAPPDADDDLTQSCETCMYYAVHRQFCDLPELRVPVEKDWSCRLWRI